MTRNQHPFAIALLLGIQFILGVPAFAQAQTVIAVMDSPADYQHPDLMKALDLDAMKSLQVTDSQGQKLSWYEYNQQMRSELKSRLSHDQTSMSEREELAAVLGHGTAVTSIVSGNPATIRVFHFAFNGYHTEIGLTDIESILNDSFQESLRLHYAEVSHALQTHKIRALNLSLGISKPMVLHGLSVEATPAARSRYQKRFPEIAQKWAETEVKEMRNLIQDNPETVFVFAAGNNCVNLSSHVTTDFACIRASNLIRVAALEANEPELAYFSNWSRTQVDLAAPGTDIALRDADGKLQYYDGTSFAAPQVTERLAELFAADPSLTAAQAVTRLLTKNTIQVSDLRTKIKDGLILDSCNEQFKAWGN